MATTLRLLPSLFAAVALIAAHVGCGSTPPATAVNTGPPPPPPVPVVATKPAPPPPKPQPDPYETALREVRTVLQRYVAVCAGVRDDATADKAVEEIGRLSTRLHVLKDEISKIPHQPSQEAQAVALYTEFSRTLTAQPSSPEVQSNLDLQIKLLAAQQSFIPEFLAIGQAVAPQQPTAPPTPATEAQPQR
jgi:hypothetical protein